MRRRRADPLYVALMGEAARAGFFRPARAAYAAHVALLLALFTTGYVALLHVESPWLLAPLVIAVGQLATQLTYVAHDAHHRAITPHRPTIAAIGQVGMTLVAGFSYSWFAHSHGNHHDHLNERDHDLAMKYSTVLAVHPDAVRAKRGWRRRLLRWQGYYLWFLMPLYQLAMIADGLAWIARNPRTTRVDQGVLLGFVALWFVIPAAVVGVTTALWHWALVSMVSSMYVALTFALQHTGRRVFVPADEGELTLLRQQLEATRTVHTWRIWDWYYSGLNYHIEHHLFPWVPQWRYRRLRLLVKDFCRRHQLAYAEHGFWSACRDVHRELTRLGRLTDDGEGAAASAGALATARAGRRFAGR